MAANAEEILQVIHQAIIDSRIGFLTELVGLAGNSLKISPPQASGVVLALVVVVISAVLLVGVTGVSGSKVALLKDTFQPFELAEIEQVSHDSKRLRFKLQSPTHKLGLPIGQHISFKFKDNEGKETIRSYTPITSDDELGYVDFVIKVYFANKHPHFPKGGVMTQHLNGMKVGDTMLMRGPKGHVNYQGYGKYTIKPLGKEQKSYNKKRFGFIAGGSGITPCMQVVRDMLKRSNDGTKIWLLYANVTEGDILLRQELESLAVQHKDRFSLHYTLDKAPKDWKGSEGWIVTEMCENHLPAPGDDSFVFICGPPPMIKYAVEPSLREMGYKDSQWFAF